MGESKGREGAVTDQLDRFSPALFARHALDHLSTATYVERRMESGQPTDVIEIVWDAGSRVRAHIAADGRILAIEALGFDPLTGDANLMDIFEGERMVDGLVFAERVRVIRNGQPLLSFQLKDVAVNRQLDPAIFDPPALNPLTTAQVVNSLGGGAYEITGIDGGAFRVVFFDLGDGVAVFDAPVSRAKSAWVADQIRKTVGDKPIKYLIVSHFHDDHVAGVGYYVDHGVKIVTTRANAPVIARYATMDSALTPDLPALGREPDFLFIDAVKLTLGQDLTIYKLIDCPHAKDMIIAYQPSHRTIVEADLFVELAGYSDASAAFSKWMARPAAPPVDWIIGTHLARISRASFEAAAKDRPS